MNDSSGGPSKARLFGDFAADLRYAANNRKKGVDNDDVAPGNFADWRARSTAFSGLAAADRPAHVIVFDILAALR
jgi:hypothetical protein